VPMTMTTFAVLAVGMLYGGRLGALTVLAYIAQGAVGLPVFANGANLMVLLAAPFTAGYIVGFVFAAGVVGWVYEQRPGILGAAVGCVAATVIIYALGVAWLSVMLGNVEAAVLSGMVPFLLGDALEAALAIAVATGLGRVGFGNR
jgi:biotin transport system substrate-specific component